MLPFALLLACVHVAREVDLDRAGPVQQRVYLERDHLPAKKLPRLPGSAWLLAAEIPSTGPVQYELVLGPGGALESHSARDTTPDNDRWWVDGAELVLSMNDGFVVYRGVFVAVDRVEGEAGNERGEVWTFEMGRAE